MSAQLPTFSSQALPRDSTEEQLKQYFNNAAKDYDKIMFDETIWEGAIRLTDTFASVHGDSNKGLKILDLGCGTGIIGSLLAKHGYTNIQGLDLSEKMMEKAEEKKVYNKFICAVVTAKRLDIPTGDYDALIGAGAITSGYIKPDAMDEVVRLVKPGGYIVFTIRKDVYENEDHYGYQAKFQELEDQKKWRLTQKNVDVDYLLGSELEYQKKCYIFVFQVV